MNALNERGQRVGRWVFELEGIRYEGTYKAGRKAGTWKVIKPDQTVIEFVHEIPGNIAQVWRHIAPDGITHEWRFGEKWKPGQTRQT